MEDSLLSSLFILTPSTQGEKSVFPLHIENSECPLFETLWNILLKIIFSTSPSPELFQTWVSQLFSCSLSHRLCSFSRQTLWKHRLSSACMSSTRLVLSHTLNHHRCYLLLKNKQKQNFLLPDIQVPPFLSYRIPFWSSCLFSRLLEHSLTSQWIFFFPVPFLVPSCQLESPGDAFFKQAKAVALSQADSIRIVACEAQASVLLKVAEVCRLLRSRYIPWHTCINIAQKEASKRTSLFSNKYLYGCNFISKYSIGFFPQILMFSLL